MTSAGVTIRKAMSSEAERLADIALLAWDRDLRPFLSGEAASPAVEKRRLSQVVHELLDRVIVAEADEIAVGWCARARSRRATCPPAASCTPRAAAPRRA